MISFVSVTTTVGMLNLDPILLRPSQTPCVSPRTRWVPVPRLITQSTGFVRIWNTTQTCPYRSKRCTTTTRKCPTPFVNRSNFRHRLVFVTQAFPSCLSISNCSAFCERIDIKPLSTADFGKVMKQVFPGIRPRRLGTRGHSRYCYAAMRKATKLAAPKLPDLSSSSTSTSGSTGGGEVSNGRHRLFARKDV